MYTYLTTAASRLCCLNHLKQLHAQIILNSLHQTSFWVSLLITQCTRIRAPISYAHLIFNSSTCHNSFLCTSMIKYFFHLGAHDQVFITYRKMLRDHMLPDAFVYPILIKSAGKYGIVLHAHVIKLGFSDDDVVRNAVMNSYVKSGHLGVARELFDEMPDRSFADWNLMISGYWRWGLYDKARELFDLMPDRNVITWTSMITGYSKMKDLDTARRYFDHMPEKNVVPWNAMLAGYAQNGFEEEALRLFDVMLKTGVDPNERTWITIFSSCSAKGDPCLAETLVGMLDNRNIETNCYFQTALLDMYTKCGQIKAAQDIFDRLGSQANSASWNVFISAYARIGDLASARDLFDRMSNKDIVSWNAMIVGYAQNGQSLQAIELFKQLVAIGHPKLNEVTTSSVISACGHLGALELGNWIVSLVSKMNIRFSISGYNSMIYMYSKCGNMKEAVKIFQEMKVKDVICYNTMIAGFATQGSAIEAIELLGEMQLDGIKPDRVTFIAALTACSHAGLLEVGRKIFDSINCPSVDHYACMVDLLGRVGELDEALRLINRMPMEPHAGVYGSLLNASRIHKRVDIGEFAANKLFVLEPNNSGVYTLLSNLYAGSNRWKDVERIRKKMNQKGVRKAVGWSLVEYDGKMHEFIAGDRSHERTADIYRLLSELRRKMREFGYVPDISCTLTDIEEEEKEEMVGAHSEKLAICYALLVSEARSVIRVIKNLRICSDCHMVVKIISKLEGREIIVRDNNRFHCFKDGSCTCNDYW
ncbi:pentatricopeptide repeat-containing protein At1g14470 [Amaranthus tricolor]|uniref:pentatricopeptide repeat-containing protein At1g14470 n=1 Tax=Amaranthus tricolor TaxID=29722 RepID=UPI0025846C90|nr:pentatricopeptide repeat-containing protein At1g14470 [Amaranthus tricolor]